MKIKIVVSHPLRFIRSEVNRPEKESVIEVAVPPDQAERIRAAQADVDGLPQEKLTLSLQLVDED